MSEKTKQTKRMNIDGTYIGSTPCYIYVTRRKAGARTAYQVGYSTNVDGWLSLAAEKRVIYLRPFSDPIDALGHKLLLEQLSNASLRRLIRKYNTTIHKTNSP